MLGELGRDVSECTKPECNMIQVVNLAGEKILLNNNKIDTISDLKRALAETTGVSPEQQKLVIGEHMLKHLTPVAENQIEITMVRQTAVLCYLCRLSGECKNCRGYGCVKCGFTKSAFYVNGTCKHCVGRGCDRCYGCYSGTCQICGGSGYMEATGAYSGAVRVSVEVVGHIVAKDSWGEGVIVPTQRKGVVNHINKKGDAVIFFFGEQCGPHVVKADDFNKLVEVEVAPCLCKKCLGSGCRECDGVGVV